MVTDMLVILIGIIVVIRIIVLFNYMLYDQDATENGTGPDISEDSDSKGDGHKQK